MRQKLCIFQQVSLSFDWYNFIFTNWMWSSYCNTLLVTCHIDINVIFKFMSFQLKQHVVHHGYIYFRNLLLFHEIFLHHFLVNIQPDVFCTGVSRANCCFINQISKHCFFVFCSLNFQLSIIIVNLYFYNYTLFINTRNQI